MPTTATLRSYFRCGRTDLDQREREELRAALRPEVIPILYLHGLLTGDFGPALEGLLGEDAAGLSATAISRLCKE